jgi:hypothetical protein
MDTPDDLAAGRAIAEMGGHFVDLARMMIEGHPTGQLAIERVLQFAAQAVPGSEYAAITRVSGQSRPSTIAATAELPVRVDTLQFETGEGPCLQALDLSDIAHTDDLSEDRQWPQFAARAVSETGIRSMLSFRLFLSQKERAALNFYAHSPRAFDSLSLSIGAIFSAYASLTLINELNRDESMQLHRALESNREIGMAMGILMARELHTAEQAFGRLRAASQHLHRKLHDIATEVIHTGELPHHSAPSAAREESAAG